MVPLPRSRVRRAYLTALSREGTPGARPCALHHPPTAGGARWRATCGRRPLAGRRSDRQMARMGRQAALDIQAQLRRQLVGAPKRAPEPAKPQRPLPKTENTHALLAAQVDKYGNCYLCRDAKHGYWAATSHIER